MSFWREDPVKAGRTLSSMLFVVCIIVLTSGEVISEKELAPDFTLLDIDGNTFTLSDHRGKVVLIDFTFAGGGPNEAMQGQLKEIREHFDEQELVIISIDVMESNTIEDIRNFKTIFGGEWTYAKDTQDLKTSYGLAYTPTEYVIDVNGYVHFKTVGVIGWEELVDDIEDAKTGYEPPETTWDLTLMALAILIVVVVVIVVVLVYLLPRRRQKNP